MTAKDFVIFSIYDKTKKNLKIAKRESFLIQMMYMGKFQPSVGAMTIYKLIQDDLENETKICDEYSKVTGLLLMYKDCFINKITCTQDVAYKHLDVISKSKQVSAMKILYHWPHCIQREFQNWYMISITPKKVSENLDTHVTREKAFNIITDVIETIYKLSEYLAKSSKGILRPSVTEKLISKVPHLIPTISQLDFCFEQTILTTVQKALEQYHRITSPVFNSDIIWPLPTNYTAICNDIRIQPTEDDHQSNKKVSSEE